MISVANSRLPATFFSQLAIRWAIQKPIFAFCSPKFFKALLFSCLSTLVLTGCSGTERIAVQTLSGYALGTSYSVKLVTTLDRARSLELSIAAVLSDINSRMSTYLPNSELSKFARHPLDQPFDVDEKTAIVVAQALDVAAVTKGAFDPTVAPLVDLWGFGPLPQAARIPETEEINTALAGVGFSAILADTRNHRLTKLAPRALDLSAIAKGYAVDQLADLVEAKGINNYLIEVGGEMRFAGTKPSEQAWRVAIEKPVAAERSPLRLLSATEGALATSGDYRNFFEVGGQRYSHTINPKTGYPISHDLASVTVFAKTATEADAYATGLLVMGRAAAAKLAAELKLAIFMVYRQQAGFATQQSPEFTRLFGDFAEPATEPE